MKLAEVVSNNEAGVLKNCIWWRTEIFYDE